MKKSVLQHCLIILCVLASMLFISCKKDEGKLPTIVFKTDSGYTYSNASVTKNQIITMGINASKAEDKDVLKTFNGSVSYDGAANTTIVQESLSGAQGDNYSKDVMITTRNQNGSETYTFTVTNRDGLSNKVSLTLTVN